MHIIFKLDDSLYVNPTFIQFGKKYPTNLLERMMKKDKTIRLYLPYRTVENASLFTKVT